MFPASCCGIGRFRFCSSATGTVRTVFPVRFADGGWALAAGSEAWRYHVFSPEGRELWRRQVYHGATVGLAADLDGDGNDEIVAGNEYYYHLIFDRNGRELDRKTTAPWIYSAVAADLDGDGRAEAVTGRSDGVCRSPVRPRTASGRGASP